MHISWGRLLLLGARVHVMFIFLALLYGNKILVPAPDSGYQKTD